MKTIEHFVGTGYKSEFYTLWSEVTVDQRKRDENGNVVPSFADRPNGAGTGPMNFFIRTSFVQNLSKTKEGAIAKALELGVTIDPEEFEFNLRHYSRPSLEAFGATMKNKRKGNRMFWIAQATSQFWASWKEYKDELKSLGWAVWKNKANNTWYMIQNEVK